MPDLGRKGLPSSLLERLDKRLCDYSAFEKEIEIPQITTAPVAMEPNFAVSVFIRMLYSCLVDADFLDTERFMSNGMIQRDSGECMEVLMDKLKDRISKWLVNRDDTTVNGRRSEILRNCLEQGKAPKDCFSLQCPPVAVKPWLLWHLRCNMQWNIIWIV